MCIIAGQVNFVKEPKWHLGDTDLCNVKEIETLGVIFRQDLDSAVHVNSRISKARRSMYRLSGVGISYPGLAAAVKAYVWKTVGVASLTYGLDSIHLKSSSIRQLESAQGATIKSLMGIGKRCHHSALLSALHIQNVSDVIRRDTLSLGKRVLAIASPVRDLFIFLFSKAVITGQAVHGTLVDRIVRYGLSPLDLFPFFQHSFNFSKQRSAGQSDGIVHVFNM